MPLGSLAVSRYPEPIYEVAVTVARNWLGSSDKGASEEA